MANDNNFASANLTMGQLNACVKKMGGEKVLVAFLREEYELVKVAKAVQKLLTQIGDLVVIPTTETNFIAAEKFVFGTGSDTELKISYSGSNFQKWFLGKVENSRKVSKLKVQKLRKKSLDQPILDELGGEEKAETTLCEMFGFLKTAPHTWYIFYVKDVSDRLRAVSAHWDNGGWGLSGYELHASFEWDADGHVVSLN